MYLPTSSTGATTVNVTNNTIANIASVGAGGTVYGIYSANIAPTYNINNNSISGLSTTGAASANGIYITGATTGNIYKNKIYNISASNFQMVCSFRI